MKIPTYGRQIVEKAVPKSIPTPIYEAQRQGIQSKQNVFGLRGNLKKIDVYSDMREKGYDLHQRGLDLSQDKLDLSQEKLDESIRHNKVQTALSWAQLGLKAADSFVRIYQASMDSQTAKAIETYNQEMQLHDNELARKNYALGDVNDIDAQYRELTAFNFEANEAAIGKATEGIQNQKVKGIVEDYARQSSRQRMQLQRFKFEDAKQQQMRTDLIGCVDSAATRGDFDAIDNYLRIGVQNMLFTPDQAVKMDGIYEKSIVNGQLARGVKSIFENGGDAKDARDFIMQYDPAISGRQNYTLTTEDREAFYKEISSSKKIDDALVKERKQKYLIQETDRLMTKVLDGTCTLEDITSSGLPAAKEAGFESQYSQKYFHDLLIKKANNSIGAKQTEEKLRDLNNILEDTARTYYEKYTAVQNSYGRGELTDSKYNSMMSRLKNTPEGAVVQSSVKLIRDSAAANGGFLTDGNYNAALEEFYDGIKLKNYDNKGLTDFTNEILIKYGRKDAMKYLEFKNEGEGFLGIGDQDPDSYLANNQAMETDRSYTDRKMTEIKQLERERREDQYQRLAQEEIGRPLTDEELTEVMKQDVDLETYDDDFKEENTSWQGYDMANDSGSRNVVKSILEKFGIKNLDVTNITRKTTATYTAFMFQDTNGKYYHFENQILKVYDEEAGEWKSL